MIADGATISHELLFGWGNYRREWCAVSHPQTAVEAIGVVAARNNLISRGLGRSYGDAAVNGRGGVISHRAMNRLLSFDDATGVLTCEAGVSFDEIIRFALPRGFFPWVTPGTRFVTLGGAIAADVHGKNHPRDGSFAASLIDFRLLTAAGELLDCSRQRNAAVFWATVGGMGLTGAVLDARIRLRPVATGYMTVEHQRTRSFEETLDAFECGDRFTYSVAWLDCLTGGRAVLTHAEHAPADQLQAHLSGEPLSPRHRRSASIPYNLPAGLMNRWTARALGTLYYHCPRRRRAIVPYQAFFYPLDAVAHWNRLYGRRGLLQYQAVFPTATARNGVGSMLGEIARSREAPLLAVLKRFGAANEGLLSFPMPGFTLAVDFPNTGATLLELLARLDELVIDCGGRVYLTKDARLPRAAFEQMYSRAGEFRQVKRKLDPHGQFTSSLARRLGLTGKALRVGIAHHEFMVGDAHPTILQS